MSCQTKEERIKNLVSKGLNQEEAAKVVANVDKMELEERVDVMRHPFTNIIRMANGVGVTHLLRPMELTHISKKDGVYSIKGNRNGKEVTAKVGPEGNVLTLDNGITLDVKDLDNLVSDLEFIQNTNGYETIVTDMLNDPSKIMGLARELAEDNDIVLGEGYKNELLTHLDSLVEPLTRLQATVNVHLNRHEREQAGKVKIDPRNVDVYISENLDRRTKSKLEVYVHELYHAVTGYALGNKDPSLQGIRRDIANIRDEFLKNISAERLVELSVLEEGDTAITLEDANRILDYISNGKTGMEEFVAHAMTNKVVMRGLYTIKTKQKEEHKNLISKLVAKVRDLLDTVIRKVTKAPATDNDYQQMMWLVSRLTHEHRKANEGKASILFSKVGDVFDNTEQKIVKQYSKFADKQKGVIPLIKKENPNNWDKTVYLGKLTFNAMFNEQSKRILEHSLSQGSKLFAPEGSIKTAIRDMSQSDTTQDLAEVAGLQGMQIDQSAKYIEERMRKAIKTGFSRELNEVEEVMLTDVLLDTDASALVDDYDISTLMDQDTLNTEIEKLEDKLKKDVDTKSFNYYQAQSEALARYMVHGSGNIAVQLNANNIAKKLDTKGELETVSDTLVKNIDMLTSMRALKLITQEKRAEMKTFMDSELEGTVNMLVYHKGSKNRAEEELFRSQGEKVHMVKGHLSEVYDEDTETKAAPMANREALEKEGYKFVKVLKKHSKDSNPTEIGLFITTKLIRQSFQVSGLRIADKHRVGTTITESYVKSGVGKESRKLAKYDIDSMRKITDIVVAEMENGTYKVDEDNENTIVPLRNTSGKIVDYRYVMLKKDKIKYLKMDRRADLLLGKTFARTHNKAMTISFNDEIMELIKKDAEENYREGRKLGKNLKEYIKIHKGSGNKEVRELWNVLPDDLKRKYPEGFVVRRDLMHSYLGFRHMSITDYSIFEHLPATAKYAIRVAEEIWKELIKITKADIIIRTPAVLMGNIWSNFMVPIMMGHNPLEVMKLSLQGVRELNEYIKGVKEVYDIQGKIDAGIATQADKRRMNVIQENLNKSSVKELVDANFYTSIIEEMEAEDSHKKGIIGKFVDNKLESTPQIFRSGVDLLYLTEKSLPYKLIATATQYSDFVARYAQYHLMVRNGTDKEKAVKTVRDYYINYNKPNGKFVEWMNQLGLIMFTKYFVRIQKAIKDYGTTHPLKALLFITGQHAFIGDVADITDASILSKDLGVLFYNPFEAPMEAASPELYEWIKPVFAR